jgi:redox-sensing transcriptional repressor
MSDSSEPNPAAVDALLSRMEEIPAPAVRRLSLYLRQLEHYLAAGKMTVSSKQLGDALGTTDAQVRKDLAYFGQFGHRGVGYRVDELVSRVRRILGTDRIWNILLIGAGHLGTALTAYGGFVQKGFQIVAVFDTDAAKVGTPIPSLPGRRIQPMSELNRIVEDQDIRLAMLSVPASAAQQVANQAVAAGIRGILNFAPVTLSAPAHVSVVDVDLAVQLEQLSYRVSLDRMPHRLASA